MRGGAQRRRSNLKTQNALYKETMIKLTTSEEIKKHESEWIKENGPESSLKLMEKAGKVLAEVSLECSEPYFIICGKGNNGGDGMVCARYLISAGKKVYLFLTSDEESLSSDSKINFNLIKDKIKYSILKKENDQGFISVLNSSNTVIDCLLGTGSSKQLPPLYEWIIKEVNRAKKTVIACDIPTGVNPDSGNVLTNAIEANHTVTYEFYKIGTMLYPGRKHCGKIKLVDIGLPDIKTNYFLLDDDFLKKNLPKRSNDSNKGSFGRTLLVCGSSQYPGAALLSSRAASVIGSGLTCLSSPEEVLFKIASAIPEIIHVKFDINKILEESSKASAVVIGPGLTTEPKIKELVEKLIESVNSPIVLDADGINVLAGNKALIKKAKKEIVLTPHPKEFARLLEISTDEVLNNKLDLVRSSASELGCTIVLKGPGTIIGTKEGKIYISPFSNSALAKGGTGDVLAGFIGGLISQGLNPETAACVAVYLHGKLAEVISKEKTEYSLLPQDLIDHLPEVMKLYV